MNRILMIVGAALLGWGIFSEVKGGGSNKETTKPAAGDESKKKKEPTADDAFKPIIPPAE